MLLLFHRKEEKLQQLRKSASQAELKFDPTELVLINEIGTCLLIWWDRDNQLFTWISVI